MRAAHILLDAPPHILDDKAALLLLGDTAARQIMDREQVYRTAHASALRAHVLLRSRFAEDRLAEAVARGTAQYVILGAGFDTFAWRQPAWAKALDIYEVDQPATQGMKKSQLSKMGMATPANTHFVSIDFEHESLRDGLNRNAVSLTSRTFFSWLGVTMYLKEEAVDEVFKSISEFPAGSEIVFTFTQPPESLPGDEISFHSSLAEAVAGVGEPFVSFFTIKAMEEKLRNSGFKEIGFLSPEEAEERYLQRRPLDLHLPKRSGIAYAVL